MISFCLGRIIRWVVLKNEYDLKYQFLKIYSHWFDFFGGRLRKDISQNDRAGWLKYLDILVENHDGSYIYKGLLKDYILGVDDKLESVYLTYVLRRKLSDDDSAEQNITMDEKIDDRYHYIPGDFFMIPGDKISNINITFYQPEEEVEGSSVDIKA